MRPWPCWTDELRPSTRPAAGSDPTPSSGRWRRTAAGARSPVSPLLFEVLEVACRGGLRDGRHRRSHHRVGADRAGLRPRLRRSSPAMTGPVGFDPRPAPGWWRIRLDPEARTGGHPDRRPRRPRGHGQGVRRRSGRRPAWPNRSVSACWSIWVGTSPWPAPPPGTAGPSASPPNRHAAGRGRAGGDHHRRRSGHLGDHRPDLAPQRSAGPPHRGPVDRAGRPGRLVDGVRGRIFLRGGQRMDHRGGGLGEGRRRQFVALGCAGPTGRRRRQRRAPRRLAVPRRRSGQALAPDADRPSSSRGPGGVH